MLYIRWMKEKLIYSELDNVFNTGIFKWMMTEIICMMIVPFPFLHNVVYYEEANDFSVGIAF